MLLLSGDAARDPGGVLPDVHAKVAQALEGHRCPRASDFRRKPFQALLDLDDWGVAKGSDSVRSLDGPNRPSPIASVHLSHSGNQLGEPTVLGDSPITSDLRRCEPSQSRTGNWHCDSNGDLNRGSNHKSRDLDLRFEPPRQGEIPSNWDLQFQITSDLRSVIGST